MALETLTNDRGFFQFVNAVPGMSVAVVSKDGLASAKRLGIEVREELEAQIVEPILLVSPLPLQVTLDPPTAPSGAPWKLVVESRDEGSLAAEGLVYRGEAGLDGNWEKKGLSPGRYTITVRDGDTTAYTEPVDLAPERTAFHVSLPGVKIVGRVHIGEEPLQVTLWLVGHKAPLRARFDSDEKGHFAGLLPADGRWDVEIVSKQEGLRLKLDPVEVRKPPGKSFATLDLSVPNTRLRGKVVDEKGAAVARASVLVLSSPQQPSQVATDGEGGFAMRGLAPGSLFLHAQEGDRESDWLEAHLAEDHEAPELRLVLRNRLTVEGIVLSPQGPVPGARVTAMAPSNDLGVGSGTEAVTGPAGTFTAKLSAGSQIVHLSVLAPGYAIRMLAVPLGVNPILEVPLEPIGGTLIFDLGEQTVDEVLSRRGGLLAHAGSWVPLMTAVLWTRSLRVEQRDPHKLVLPSMEAGDYMLCLGAEAQTAVPRGQEPPAAQCSQGFLAPLQELTLTLPRSPKDPATSPQ
jgi:hypothetical protein